MEKCAVIRRAPWFFYLVCPSLPRSRPSRLLVPPEPCAAGQIAESGALSYGCLTGRAHGSRNKLTEEVICALLRDFRQHGQKAVARVRQTQPAAYLKILALLVPREHKVEHSNALKNLTDEQLEAMIEYIKSSLEAQAGGSVRVIEGTTEPAGATAPAPKPKNRLMLEADTAVGPSERHRASGADLHRAKLHSSD